MQISVLIPTHNRPALFERCIESVISAYERFPVELEILVNNDSNDIREVHSGITSYTYERYDDLSSIYLSLFNRATKEYVYILEDDDIMSPDFFEVLSVIDSDIFYFNYTPYKWHPHFIKFFKYTDRVCTKDEFLDGYDQHNFQFGQICFKRKCLDAREFPVGNVMSNDFEVFKKLRGSFTTVNKFLYTQTTDGGDNLSFRRKQ